MFFGVNELFIFSVSTTLKSYVLIIAQLIFYVNNMFLLIFPNSQNVVIV